MQLCEGLHWSLWLQEEWKSMQQQLCLQGSVWVCKIHLCMWKYEYIHINICLPSSNRFSSLLYLMMWEFSNQKINCGGMDIE
jgi:hypothetical protein